VQSHAALRSIASFGLWVSSSLSSSPLSSLPIVFLLPVVVFAVAVVIPHVAFVVVPAVVIPIIVFAAVVVIPIVIFAAAAAVVVVVALGSPVARCSCPSLSLGPPRPPSSQALIDENFFVTVIVELSRRESLAVSEGQERREKVGLGKMNDDFHRGSCGGGGAGCGCCVGLDVISGGRDGRNGTTEHRGSHFEMHFTGLPLLGSALVFLPPKILRR